VGDQAHLRPVVDAEAAAPAALEPVSLLEQRFVTCPECGLLSAVHVDQQAWRVVRFVCPTSCRIEPAVIDALVAPEAATLSA